MRLRNLNEQEAGGVLVLSLLLGSGSIEKIGIATRLGLPVNYEVISRIG